MGSNWLELNLTKDEDEYVRRYAALYKAAYVETIDTIFGYARALKILHDRHVGMGYPAKTYLDALVQYGFTNRDGGPLNKAIRSHLKQLLENESDVRAWWDKVSKTRPARDWLSAKAIWTHWRESKKPPDAPHRASPYTAMKATNIELQEQLHKAEAENRLLRTDDGGNYFTAESSAEEIGDAVAAVIRSSPRKMRAVAAHLNKRAKEIEALTKTARPKGAGKGKAVGKSGVPG
jgi:hypothetical protein